MEIRNQTQADKLLKGLLRSWLCSLGFSGEFKIFYPKKKKDSLKIELYFDENNSEELTKQISKKLCELKN